MLLLLLDVSWYFSPLWLHKAIMVLQLQERQTYCVHLIYAFV